MSPLGVTPSLRCVCFQNYSITETSSPPTPYPVHLPAALAKRLVFVVAIQKELAITLFIVKDL